MVDKSLIDYSQLDPEIVPLVRVLNSYDAVTTIESCEGHKPGDSWSVWFDVSKDQLGWLTLEFLAWAINEEYAFTSTARLHICSAPPYENAIGETLHFYIEGDKDTESIDELAGWLERAKEYFIIPNEDCDL